MTQTSPPIEQRLDTLIDVIQHELRQYPNGIKEYELLQSLKPHGFFRKPDNTYLMPHEIFQAHFLLFHALYILRQQLQQSKQGWLEIEVLNIQLLPYEETTDALMLPDTLAEYYLNLDNLENTSESDVNKLIASFWHNFNKQDQRDDALAILGLVDPVSNRVIKETYRKLVMEHHPDRGGDKSQLQTINNAINILLK